MNNIAKVSDHDINNTARHKCNKNIAMLFVEI